jgi:galactokinase
VIGGPLTGTLTELPEEERGGERLARCARLLQRAGIDGERPAIAFFVPGRIEVLGKHTDYAGGRSLLTAVERGFTLVAVPRNDDVVTLVDASSRQHARFSLDPELPVIPGGWRNYPMTVARRFARNFPEARTGADIVFMSDLPPAAGLSSSSAFVVSFFLALATINRLAESPAYQTQIGGLADLADYVGAVENGYDYRGLAGDRGVGTRGGSQDQTAILCSRPGALVQFAFGPVRFEREVPLPDGYTFVIGCSGVHAAKAGAARGAYNRAAADAATLLQLWRNDTGREDAFLGTVLESHADALGRLQRIIEELEGQRAAVASGAGHCAGDGGAGGNPARSLFPDTEQLAARLEQFAAESLELIPAAGDALVAGDLSTFGHLVDRSQRLAEEGLGNQVEETIFLQRAAREEGAAAASAFGAGFGGSVWALVPEGDATSFLEAWRARYRERFPEMDTAEFFLTRAWGAAQRTL